MLTGGLVLLSVSELLSISNIMKKALITLFALAGVVSAASDSTFLVKEHDITGAGFTIDEAVTMVKGGSFAVSFDF